VGNTINEAVEGVSRSTPRFEGTPLTGSLQAKVPGRSVSTYDLPKEVSDSIRSVGLVELTTEEELMAAKRAHGDPMRLAYELAKQSLVEVNGSQVSLGDGTSDKAWGAMGPMVRNLVLTAYAELHAAPEEATKLFLRSRKVRLG